MGTQKKTRKFAQVKRIIGRRDARLKENQAKQQKTAAASASSEIVREIPQLPSSLFFEHNTALQPPYNILVDTNFLNHSITHKLPLMETAMSCLLASVNIVITDCVMAELEKLGTRYRLALRVARDPRWERLRCDHKGTYADDCLVDRVQKHRVYLVATNDRNLKRRLRKVPGVPLMSVGRGKFVIERLPGVSGT